MCLRTISISFLLIISSTASTLGVAFATQDQLATIKKKALTTVAVGLSLLEWRHLMPVAVATEAAIHTGRYLFPLRFEAFEERQTHNLFGISTDEVIKTLRQAIWLRSVREVGIGEMSQGLNEKPSFGQFSKAIGRVYRNALDFYLNAGRLWRPVIADRARDELLSNAAYCIRLLVPEVAACVLMNAPLRIDNTFFNRLTLNGSLHTVPIVMLTDLVPSLQPHRGAMRFLYVLMRLYKEINRHALSAAAATLINELNLIRDELICAQDFTLYYVPSCETFVSGKTRAVSAGENNALRTAQGATITSDHMRSAQAVPSITVWLEDQLEPTGILYGKSPTAIINFVKHSLFDIIEMRGFMRSRDEVRSVMHRLIPLYLKAHNTTVTHYIQLKAFLLVDEILKSEGSHDQDVQLYDIHQVMTVFEERLPNLYESGMAEYEI